MDLTLVPCGVEKQNNDLRLSLEGLGYRVTLMAPDVWAARSLSQHPLSLIQVGADAYPRDMVLATLSGKPQPPSLGVFSAGQAWDGDMASACAEFLCWPCSEAELDARLARLCCRIGHKPGAFEKTSLLAEFSDLNLIGRSSAFVESLTQIKRVARCDVPVLIEGETGTGKELAARAIHYLSQRRDYPFIPVNCGAIPDNLVENELFGHERGAFTDAKEAQTGLIGQAEGGTLFLDEIETLPAKAQAALLRFLQDRHYRPLGGKRSRQADLRVIAASNTDLEKLVSHGDFRQDLLFRLKIMWITLPPLREREGDALFLAEHFLQQFSIEHELGSVTLHPQTRDWIQRHCWPGNVRELENCILRELLLTETDQIHFGGNSPLRERRASKADRRLHCPLTGRMREAKKAVIAEFERMFLIRLLEATGGNVSEAARRAGKERRAFGKLLARYGIDRSSC